ncbi:MAG TPA: VOC family protein [Gemmatimonadaceae bacterium]|nr:VOC family protein [Gemmatimonadaceae bacterium]
MPRPVHFEISANNPERAANFYRDVFGWDITRADGTAEYWFIATGNESRGIDGGLMRREAWNRGTVNTIEVHSLDETLLAVSQGGGKIVDGKMAITGVGWLAYCEDSEGNRFGVMQPDPTAA